MKFELFHLLLNVSTDAIENFENFSAFGCGKGNQFCYAVNFISSSIYCKMPSNSKSSEETVLG